MVTFWPIYLASASIVAWTIPKRAFDSTGRLSTRGLSTLDPAKNARNWEEVLEMFCIDANHLIVKNKFKRAVLDFF